MNRPISLITVPILLLVLSQIIGCSARQGPQFLADEETPVIFEVDDEVRTARTFCVYKIFEIKKGNCPEFKANTTVCVICPRNGKCPGKAGGKSGFELVDRRGNFLCRGTWVRRAIPDGCSTCPDGVKRRYAFFGGPIDP